MGSRYCQRCGRLVTLLDTDRPQPCRECGSTNFDVYPKKHVTGRGYELTPDDVNFLRTQGIKPGDQWNE